jgi:hypothetical protein
MTLTSAAKVGEEKFITVHVAKLEAEDPSKLEICTPIDPDPESRTVCRFCDDTTYTKAIWGIFDDRCA